ncbi:Mpo1-like protein [Marinobacter sp. OP 3.4]|uniref:Mpo1-like protein n=1 Tax=Marinobacter sp. OP 3.4 TaxID=3076501 RepID=UPI002E1E34A5
MSDQSFQSFSEFYPYYLDEHRDRNCRRLHFVGSLLVLAVLASVLLTGAWWWLLAIPVIGYGFAWVGHFFFEKNRPATFKHPLYSLMGDWVMFRDILIGRIPF